MVHRHAGASGTEVPSKPSTSAFPWFCGSRYQMQEITDYKSYAPGFISGGFIYAKVRVCAKP